MIDGTISPINRPGQGIWAADEAGVLLGILGGSVIGTGVGVWLGGRSKYVKANLGLTLLGSVIGGAIGWGLGIYSLGLLSPLIAAGPIAGGMLGFNLSRRWAQYPGDNPTGSVRAPGPLYGSFTVLDLRF